MPGDWAHKYYPPVPIEEEVERLAEEEAGFDAQEYDDPTNQVDSSSGDEAQEDLDVEYDVAI